MLRKLGLPYKKTQFMGELFEHNLNRNESLNISKKRLVIIIQIKKYSRKL